MDKLQSRWSSTNIISPLSQQNSIVTKTDWAVHSAKKPTNDLLIDNKVIYIKFL